MGSRNYAQVAPTPETMALNAYIFMYGGHSLVTPHATLKQLWWTDERIEAKITRPFVISKLRGQERDFLDRALAFGEGLTDDTYMDWILDRAKRLFLILTEIGVPDQIFGCIDDSWTDDDLPLSPEDITNLELAYENDEALNKKFYDMQFVYLLRQLRRDSHIDYGPKEHIPMDYANTYPPAVTLQAYDRVHFPGRPEEVFMRRKFPLVDKDTGQSHRGQFMRDVQRAKTLNHKHIATLWASYTSDNAGYVISDFVPQHTLATFMEHRMPPQFMRLPVVVRKVMLCEWMHCLADALAFIHDRGTPHAAVRPSGIWISNDNHISFADIGYLRTFQRGKRLPKTEAYDYAAPECQCSKQSMPSSHLSSPPTSSIMSFSRRRRPSACSSLTVESAATDNDALSRSNSIYTISKTETITSPITPPSPKSHRSSSFIHMATQKTKNFSRIRPTWLSSPVPTPTTPNLSPPLSREHSSTNPPETPADIFSLGCIYLDLLTFLVKGKLTDFIKFRSTPSPTIKPSKLTPAHPTVATPVLDTKGDTSFHASLTHNPLKLASWLTNLRDDAHRQSTAIQASRNAGGKKSGGHRALSSAAAAAADAHTITHVLASVSPLLELVEQMLSPIPSLRPGALEVRDAVRDVLQGGEHEGGLTGTGRGLCCEGRDWVDTGGMEGFVFGLEGEE